MRRRTLSLKFTYLRFVYFHKCKSFPPNMSEDDKLPSFSTDQARDCFDVSMIQFIDFSARISILIRHKSRKCRRNCFQNITKSQLKTYKPQNSMIKSIYLHCSTSAWQVSRFYYPSYRLNFVELVWDFYHRFIASRLFPAQLNRKLIFIIHSRDFSFLHTFSLSWRFEVEIEIIYSSNTSEMKPACDWFIKEMFRFSSSRLIQVSFKSSALKSSALNASH